MTENAMTKCVGRTAPCTCDHCISNCKRNPGWFTPDDAEKALDAGHAKRMMLDYWLNGAEVEDEGDNSIYILAPASITYEGTLAPMGDFAGMVFGTWCKGRCTFLNAQDRCDIHDSGYKPQQCKFYTENVEVKDTWNNERGRALVARWRKETGEIGRV